MEPRPIIALLGKKRVGKDTFASRLVDTHGYTRIAFADPLKFAALVADPIIDRTPKTEMRLAAMVQAMGWERAKEDAEVRRFLQNFGVGLRTIIPTVWVDAALAIADSTPGPLVFTDVRFENELEALLDRGAVSVRIVRPGLDSTDTHISETALDDAEAQIVVTNDGTVADLHEAADAAAKFALLSRMRRPAPA